MEVCAAVVNIQSSPQPCHHTAYIPSTHTYVTHSENVWAFTYVYVLTLREHIVDE